MAPLLLYEKSRNVGSRRYVGVLKETNIGSTVASTAATGDVPSVSKRSLIVLSERGQYLTYRILSFNNC